MDVYLYQIIHTLGHKPYYLAEHVALLDTLSRKLFHSPYQVDLRKLSADISMLLQSEHYPMDLSAFVRLTLTPDGASHLTAAGSSLYRGYALRSITPAAITLSYDIPLLDASTSAREAAADLARNQALCAGAKCAVRCTREGVVLTADDAPLFAIRGLTVFTSPAENSVERNLALACIRAAGLEVSIQPVMREQIPLFDEFFYFDHQGITALSRCDGQPYMAVVVERIAKMLRELTR
ncbi:MAG: branched-chain amino acid aminotransferase [Alistipes sp.]